jgi:hypothetical protein
VGWLKRPRSRSRTGRRADGSAVESAGWVPVEVAPWVATVLPSSPLSQPAKTARHTATIDAQAITRQEYGNDI